MQMVVKKILIREYLQSFLLGPNPEPECDAAVASLVEMGFSEVNIFLSIAYSILLFFFAFLGKSSFSIIHSTLEHQ
jgi:hypothetical protein